MRTHKFSMMMWFTPRFLAEMGAEIAQESVSNTFERELERHPEVIFPIWSTYALETRHDKMRDLHIVRASAQVYRAQLAIEAA